MANWHESDGWCDDDEDRSRGREPRGQRISGMQATQGLHVFRVPVLPGEIAAFEASRAALSGEPEPVETVAVRPAARPVFAPAEVCQAIIAGRALIQPAE